MCAASIFFAFWNCLCWLLFFSKCSFIAIFSMSFIAIFFTENPTWLAPEVTANQEYSEKVKSNHMKIKLNHMKIKSNHMKIKLNHMKIKSNHMKIKSNHMKIKSNMKIKCFLLYNFFVVSSLRFLICADLTNEYLAIQHCRVEDNKKDEPHIETFLTCLFYSIGGRVCVWTDFA